MLKYTFAICLVCLWILPAAAQVAEGNATARQLNLQGNVKQVYAIYGKGDTLKTYFDKQGRLTKQETVCSAANIFIVRDNYTYNDKNQPLSFNHQSFVLSENGKLYNDSLTLKLMYNKEGRFVKANYLNTINELITAYEYFYKKRGNYIEVERVDYLAGQPCSLFRNYNAKEQLVEEWSNYPESTINLYRYDTITGLEVDNELVVNGYTSPRIWYTYNKQGDETSRKQKGGNNKWLIDTITYQYDVKGNWIEKQHSNYIANSADSFEGVTHITRIIEYYD